jgi:hypothetical protein
MDRHLWSNPDPFCSVCYHFVKIMIEKHTCESNLYYLDDNKWTGTKWIGQTEKHVWYGINSIFGDGEIML